MKNQLLSSMCCQSQFPKFSQMQIWKKPNTFAFNTLESPEKDFKLKI